MDFENAKPEDIAKALFLSRSSVVALRENFFKNPDDVQCAWFHHEWDNILINGTRNFAVQGFRESGKTQYVIRGRPLHALAFPRLDCRYIILILSSQAKASTKLKEVADEYKTNKILSSNLVEIKCDNEKAFEVDARNEFGDVCNVRIEAYGKGASIRGANHKGRRPDLVIIDDPQDLEDSLSSTVLDKDWEWFLSDIKFLGQGSRIFLIGNNLGENCIIERVFKYSHQLNFETRRIPILTKSGESNWPHKYPVDFIIQERDNFADMGKLDVWYRERMCVAMSPDEQVIKPNWLQYYEPKDLPRASLAVYMTVDPAISQKESADYSVITVVGVNPDNHWFVLDVQFGRWDPSELINNIFACASKYKPIKVGIEKVAYQAAIEHFVRKEMPRRQIFFEIEPLKAKMKKAQRMQLLQPRFANRTVWFPSGDPYWMGEMNNELLSLTPSGCKSAHDVLADCLAYMEQVAVPPTGWSTGGGYGDDIEDKLPIVGAL